MAHAEHSDSRKFHVEDKCTWPARRVAITAGDMLCECIKPGKMAAIVTAASSSLQRSCTGTCDKSTCKELIVSAVCVLQKRCRLPSCLINEKEANVPGHSSRMSDVLLQ